MASAKYCLIASRPQARRANKLLDSGGLKEAVHKEGLGRVDQLLLILAFDGKVAKKPAVVKDLGVKAGLRAIKSWNITDILRKSGLAINTPDGWELNKKGLDHLSSLGFTGTARPTTPVLVELRKAIKPILATKSGDLALEAIGCLENGFYRAGVLLAWAGAVALLHEHVVSTSLAAFNTEATGRDPKWKSAKNADGLGRMSEYDFLQVAEAVSVLGKNVKQELEGCLKLRNGCGHPTSLKIGEHKAAAHVETLLLNVYLKF